MNSTDTVAGALQVVRWGYEALARADVAGMLALASPDIEVFQSESVPWGGRHHGHAGLIDFLTGVRAALDSRVEIGELYAAGDEVIQVGRTRGYTAATRTPFDAPEVHVWRVTDDRIASLAVYVDTDVLHAALQPATPAG
jgi:ketosteroid isomerase-like protein